MKYNLRLDHIELSDFDQEQLDKKMDRLKKHLLPPFMIDVTLSHSTRHLHGNAVGCIVNIQQGKKVYHADRSADDIQTAIDQTLEALRNELEKAHGKRKKHS
ncbi:MAG: HPF/RaiA family ribosome-associated protein [Candidatus Andersenbacteria bacterium]